MGVLIDKMNLPFNLNRLKRTFEMNQIGQQIDFDKQNIDKMRLIVTILRLKRWHRRCSILNKSSGVE